MFTADFRHPLDADAVPMIGVDRAQYIAAIEAQGFTLAFDGPSGLYFRHPEGKGRALWVSWSFTRDVHAAGAEPIQEWFVKVVFAEDER